MPPHPQHFLKAHAAQESHFSHNAIVRDVVIGMSDGLTVPFALAAGLSSALDTTHLILIAGLAEIAAGAIAMGLGGYLATKSEQDHYHSEMAREHQEIKDIPEAEKAEVIDVMSEYGISKEACMPLVESLSQNHDHWVAFMMRFELGLEKPASNRAWQSALTIALAYVMGGLIPLAPYATGATPSDALGWSVGLTMTALAVFGWLKGWFMGLPPWKNALQTVVIGGTAAAIAYGVAKAIQ